MERAVRRVLVVGGGVAGPAVALLMRRMLAPSVSVTVLESRPSADGELGAFISIAPNGGNVLKAIGADVAARISRVTVPLHNFAFLGVRNKRLAAYDTATAEQDYGSAAVMVKRAHLHRELIQCAIDDGINVRFGARVRGTQPDDIRQLDDGTVQVRLTSGEVVDGDLLVACDGIRSRVRACVLPDAPRPTYVGLSGYGGYTHASRLDAATRDLLATNGMTMYWGRRGFFGAFRAPPAAGAGAGAAGDLGDVWWFDNYTPRVLPSEAELERFGADGIDAARVALAATHERDARWVREVIHGAHRIDGPWHIHDLQDVAAWHRGRVVLVGDAAHAASPSSGQGASQALEDALVLVRALRAAGVASGEALAPGALTRAFERYQALRKPRVDAVLRAGRRGGDTKKEAGPIGIAIREFMLPLFLRLTQRQMLDSYAYRCPEIEPQPRL